MAQNLNAFFAQNAQKIETEKYVASTRFVDKDKALEWEIGCITAGENNKIRQSCMTQKPVRGGKRGQFMPEFDANSYQAKISAKCTIFPDLNDPELQNSYGVMSAEELIATMLLPGEFEDYAARVLEVNGFKTETELVEEAKN